MLHCGEINRRRAVDWVAPALQAIGPALRGRADSSVTRWESFVVDLAQYLPILIYLVIALGLSSAFVFLPMGVSRLTGAHNPTADKLAEYECGFPAFEDPRSQFDVRFYLVAILFIVFDLEAAFIYPWAVTVFKLGWVAWIAMMIFIAELALGLVYAWKKGALEWE